MKKESRKKLFDLVYDAIDKKKRVKPNKLLKLLKAREADESLEWEGALEEIEDLKQEVESLQRDHGELSRDHAYLKHTLNVARGRLSNIDADQLETIATFASNLIGGHGQNITVAGVLTNQPDHRSITDQAQYMRDAVKNSIIQRFTKLPEKKS